MTSTTTVPRLHASRSLSRKHVNVPLMFYPKFTLSQRIGMRSRPISTKFCCSANTNTPGKNENILGYEDSVIIVDHGSRRQESNLMLNDFVVMFKNRTGYQIVEPAHMELAKPTIRDAFQTCVQQGATRVIISPFFLFQGRHWHQDIPALVAEAAREHSGVSYIVTAPLGLHEHLVEVVNDRIKHCLDHVAGEAGQCFACAGTDGCCFR